MGKIDKKILINLIIVGVVATGMITAFSIPFGIIPALGNVLFPGDGVWNIPGDVPEYEEMRVFNLKTDVTVIRDQWGVPHIYAENEGDLSFALGYCHAQDRLFQMDMGRRQVQGRLSEVVGEMAVETDRLNLALGMGYWSEQTVLEAERLQDEGEIDYFDDWEKYADGVNYYLATHKNELPLEYHLLGFEPEPWTVVDSMSYTAYMSSMLTMQFQDLDRFVDYKQFEAAGHPEWYFEINNPNTPYQIPVVPGYGDYQTPGHIPTSFGEENVASEIADQINVLLTKLGSLPFEEDILTREYTHGSNNWAVDAVKSNTDYPIVANDMHLAWNTPGIWYEAHLVCENTGLNTYGFTVSGVPLPLVAHNQYLGWGMTNSGMDVMDWYYYNTVNDTHYIYDNTETAYTYQTYEIKVKDQKDPIPYTVRETVHGPVLNDFLNRYEDGQVVIDNTNSEILACQWTLYNITDTYRAIYGFNHATNITEFDEASKFFHTPGQNIIYGDIYGNIQIRPTALVPIRDDAGIPGYHTGNGTMPYNGSAGHGDWIGYVPFESLPVATNPSQNYLASANQVSVGPDYAVDVGYHLQAGGYISGYRSRRINEKLDNTNPGEVDIMFMKELHSDVHSLPAEIMTPIILDEILNKYPGNRPLTILKMHNKFNSWDYIMDRNEVAPTLYRVWLNEMFEVVFGDERDTFNIDANPSTDILEFFMRENATSHWFDDVTTTPTVETLTDCVIQALFNTYDYLTRVYGTDNHEEWRWGDIHKVTYSHLMGIDSLGIGPFEADGSGFCVNPSGIRVNRNAESLLDFNPSTHGASERVIYDFSNLNNSLSVIPSGQRAVVSSRHYSDQLEHLFLQGKYHEQWFSNTQSNFPTQAIESQIYFIGEDPQ